MFRLISIAIAALAVWGIIHAMNAPVSNYAKRHEKTIVEALNEEIGRNSPVCVYNKVSFPLIVTSENRHDAYGTNGLIHIDKLQSECKSCDQLVDAGVIKIAAMEMSADSGKPSSFRYDLTSLGRATYIEKKTRIHSLSNPRFCFGTARVDKIVEALPAVPNSIGYAVSVKYTIKILDPHPFLFKPESANLGFPTLSKTGASKQKPKLATLSFFRNGEFWEITDLRYGKWINE